MSSLCEYRETRKLSLNEISIFLFNRKIIYYCLYLEEFESFQRPISESSHFSHLYQYNIENGNHILIIALFLE